MSEDKVVRSPRSSTLEVLEKMLVLANQLGLQITDIGVSALALHMKGSSTPKVAAQLGISRSSADALIWRGLYELEFLEKALSKVVEENKRLKSVKEEYALLRQAVGSNEADLMISKQRIENKVEAGLIDKQLLKRLSLSIYELGFSTRVCNALRAGDKLTLGDIAKSKRSELEHYRHLGAKGLAEIDKALADAGLTYEFEL